MKLIRLIILPDLLRLLLLLLVPLPVLSQSDKETRLGTMMAIEVEKELSRKFSGVIEEEVRLVDNRIGFDRSVSTLGFDYTFLNQKAKVGVYYAYIYLYNSDYLFEQRHRFYLNISYKEIVAPFTFSWRGRLQSTYRDEDIDSYKINPKYVMKNKLEVAYTIWGSPWKPFLLCDFSTMLNDPVTAGYEFIRMRFMGGVNWRLNRTTYLEFFLRYDKEMDWRDPDVFSLGVSYKIKK